MTTQVQTLQEIETGTKKGQRVISRAAKDQLARIGQSRVLWDYKTVVKSGTNQIHLDATNAAFAR